MKHWRSTKNRDQEEAEAAPLNERKRGDQQAVKVGEERSRRGEFAKNVDYNFRNKNI